MSKGARCSGPLFTGERAAPATREYLEIFHYRRRRHSTLGNVGPNFTAASSRNQLRDRIGALPEQAEFSTYFQPA